MSVDMIIYSIKTNSNSHTVYEQAGDIVHQADVIESVIEKCRENWHLEGECGFIGELTGTEFFEVVNIPDITHALDENEVYRIEVCW